MIHTSVFGSVIDVSVPMVVRAVGRLLRERLRTLDDEFAAGLAGDDAAIVAHVDTLAIAVHRDCQMALDMLDMADDDCALLGELADCIEQGGRVSRTYLAPHLAEAARTLRLALQAGQVGPALRAAEALKAAATRAEKTLAECRTNAAKWSSALGVAVERNTARALARCSSAELQDRGRLAGLRAGELQQAYSVRYRAQRAAPDRSTTCKPTML